MKNFGYILLITLLLGCQSGKQETANKEAQKASSYEVPTHHTETLTQLFDAHGGYERWSSMQSLTYQKGEESTITHLQNRKILVSSPDQTIGFDGEDVWIIPDTVDASRARFYHNLYFYFYAMPFVVGDPGAIYENVEPRELAGKLYEGIKVSYGAGVGDAPDDNYIIWYDGDTKRMEWLMYTVTYKSGEPSDKYKLIKYASWKDFSGLLLPTSLQWYAYEAGQVGDPKGDPVIFDQVQITTEEPDDSLFTKPDSAQVAPR